MQLLLSEVFRCFKAVFRSVADPYVFTPPGSASGSVCHRYGSGSGSFNHQAKIIRKTLILLFCDFFGDFLSLKNDDHSNEQKETIVWLRFSTLKEIENKLNRLEPSLLDQGFKGLT
jgi:hypothetical protein